MKLEIFGWERVIPEASQKVVTTITTWAGLRDPKHIVHIEQVAEYIGECIQAILWAKQASRWTIYNYVFGPDEESKISWAFSIPMHLFIYDSDTKERCVDPYSGGIVELRNLIDFYICCKLDQHWRLIRGQSPTRDERISCMWELTPQSA